LSGGAQAARPALVGEGRRARRGGSWRVCGWRPRKGEPSACACVCVRMCECLCAQRKWLPAWLGRANQGCGEGWARPCVHAASRWASGKAGDCSLLFGRAVHMRVLDLQGPTAHRAGETADGRFTGPACFKRHRAWQELRDGRWTEGRKSVWGPCILMPPTQCPCAQVSRLVQRIHNSRKAPVWHIR